MGDNIMNEHEDQYEIQPQKQMDVAEYELMNQCLVIRLKRDLDHHSAKEIRERTDKMIDRGVVRNIVFDFEDVTFMDSSGIGSIMGRYKRVIYSGGQVGVVHVSETIERIIKLSGLYKIIKNYASITEAFDSMK